MADITDREKAAFEFVRDTVKQFITLATGLVALTVTFGKDFATSLSGSDRTWALASWAVLLLSVVCGLWALLALTGTIEPKGQAAQGPVSVRGTNVVIPVMAQVVTFLVGLLFMVVFGVKAT